MGQSKYHKDLKDKLKEFRKNNPHYKRYSNTAIVERLIQHNLSIQAKDVRIKYE